MVKVRAGLHEHLRTSSSFGVGDFNRMVDVASSDSRLGFGGVLGLTNYSDGRFERVYDLEGYDHGWADYHKRAFFVPKEQLLVVKAQEVPTTKGHLLMVGVPYGIHLRDGMTPEDTVREARDVNALVVADHPFGSHGIGRYLLSHPEFVSGLDALEVFNGEAVLPGANRTAKDFFREASIDRRLGALSSSDGHSFYELGRCWSEIDSPVVNGEYYHNSLIVSVRSTNLSTPRSEEPSLLGALDHKLDLLALTFLLRTPGIRGSTLARRFSVSAKIKGSL